MFKNLRVSPVQRQLHLLHWFYYVTANVVDEVPARNYTKDLGRPIGDDAILFFISFNLELDCRSWCTELFSTDVN